jgi:hypothetical protein
MAEHIMYLSPTPPAGEAVTIPVVITTTEEEQWPPTLARIEDLPPLVAELTRRIRALNEPVLHPPPQSETPATHHSPASNKPKRATIRVRMIAVLDGNPDAFRWSARKWATYLGSGETKPGLGRAPKKTERYRIHTSLRNSFDYEGLCCFDARAHFQKGERT